MFFYPVFCITFVSVVVITPTVRLVIFKKTKITTTMKNLNVTFAKKGTHFQNENTNYVHVCVIGNEAENSWHSQTSLGYEIDEEVEEDELIDAFHQWHYDNEIQPAIEKIVEKMKELYAVNSISFSGDEIEIDYSFNLEEAAQTGYNLDDYDEPEAYQLDGTIEINIEPNGKYEKSSRVDVYSCQAEKGQGDWNGYEIDYSGISRNNIIDYLEDLLEKFEEFEELKEIEEIEEIMLIETNPHNAYNNAYLHIGKRKSTEQLFFQESTNHLPHNHTSLIGQASWKKIEDYQKGKENEQLDMVTGDIIEDWKAYMSAEQLDIIEEYLKTA